MRWIRLGNVWVVMPGVHLFGEFRLCPAIEGWMPCTALVKDGADGLQVVTVIDHIGRDEYPDVDDLMWMREGKIYYAFRTEAKGVCAASILGRPGYVVMDGAKVVDVVILPVDGEGTEEDAGQEVGNYYYAAAMMAASIV